MTIGKEVKARLKGPFVSAKNRVQLEPGDVVRITREFQELSQNELARRSGLPQSTISGIEKKKVKLGVERAKMLARALKVHPSVLLFPQWEFEESAA